MDKLAIIEKEDEVIDENLGNIEQNSVVTEETLNETE